MPNAENMAQKGSLEHAWCIYFIRAFVCTWNSVHAQWWLGREARRWPPHWPKTGNSQGVTHPLIIALSNRTSVNRQDVCLTIGVRCSLCKKIQSQHSSVLEMHTEMHVITLPRRMPTSMVIAKCTLIINFTISSGEKYTYSTYNKGYKMFPKL